MIPKQPWVLPLPQTVSPGVIIEKPAEMSMGEFNAAMRTLHNGICNYSDARAMLVPAGVVVLNPFNNSKNFGGYGYTAGHESSRGHCDYCGTIHTTSTNCKNCGAPRR